MPTRRINTVILGFTPPMDGFHVKGMGEDEVGAVLFTQIRDSVPAMHALNANDTVIAERLEPCQ